MTASKSSSTNQKRSAVLSDKAISLGRQISADASKAKKFLVEAGIVTQSGKLAAHYRKK